MHVAFAINARNKERYIDKAVVGALSQTYPCDVLLSDQQSTDNTLARMQSLKDAYLASTGAATAHRVTILRCPIAGAYGMKAMNAHFAWIVGQTKADWIFQSSGDDFSLPDRVKVCMEAVENNPCSAVATTMFFAKPDEKQDALPVSGYPQQSGYVRAGEGLLNLAYGSVIAGYRRDFLEKVSVLAGANTPDVLFGYLAALMDGFYVVCDPQHVHQQIADTQNTGFQGKLRGASGDLSMQIAECNHAQLFRLYRDCAEATHQLNLAVPPEDYNAVVQMMLNQSCAWLDARERLSANNVIPMQL